MRQNKGFTLVEILVVIAIVAILSGSVVAGFSNVKYANFKKAATKVNNEISECRATCMSHENPVYTYFYKYDGDLYFYTTENGRMTFAQLQSSGGTKVANSNVKLYYVNNGDATNTYHELADNNFIEISFKLNGSFRTGAPDGDAANNTAFYKRIKIAGETNSRIIKMTQETGKHYMN